MKDKNFPKITVILRGYSYDDAIYILDLLVEAGVDMAVEVTTNSQDYLKIIGDGNEKYGDELVIGAGTIINIDQAKAAISKGAKFLLGPGVFSEDIFEYARKNKVVTVPGAMTPSEVKQMFDLGADIVKVFPADVLTPRHFKQLLGPYGKRPIMAVGGVNKENAGAFLENGAEYLGIGSSIFSRQDVVNRNSAGILESIDYYSKLVKEKSGNEDE